MVYTQSHLFGFIHSLLGFTDNKNTFLTFGYSGECDRVYTKTVIPHEI